MLKNNARDSMRHPFMDYLRRLNSERGSSHRLWVANAIRKIRKNCGRAPWVRLMGDDGRSVYIGFRANDYDASGGLPYVQYKFESYGGGPVWPGYPEAEDDDA